MRKWIIGIIAVIVIGGGAYAYSTGALGQAAQAPKTATPMAAVESSHEVVTDGKVVPARGSGLGLASSGIVAKILVAEGDSVQTGQTILQLDNAPQSAALAQAQASLKRAQAGLDQAKAGAREQEIASAKAGVDVAQAQLNRVQQGARPDEIAAAESAVTAAEASLEKVKEGPDESQIITAKANLANAEAALKNAQGNYDKIANYAEAPMLPQSLALEQATNNYHAAKSQLDTLLSQPTAAAIASAEAALRQAQAARDKVKAGATGADVAAAEAQLRQAQAQLALVQAGARPETVAAADADVAVAQSAVDQAKVALNQTELKAPFAGVVASLNINVGEQVVPGNPVANLADTSLWQIETTDLTELMVNNVKVGDKATMSFDAIPDLKLTGQVVKIKQLGQTKQGDIIYTATIKPDQNEPRLR